MKQKKDPHHGAAVADEDPDHSPMDETEESRDQKHQRPPDEPGAAGFRSARADEDTYD